MRHWGEGNLHVLLYLHAMNFSINSRSGGLWRQVGFHQNIQWLTSMAICFVQINVAQELTCHNSHLSVDVLVHIEYYIYPITACAILQGGCKDNFGQITKCFLLHTYFVQEGHYINDTSRRFRDHISWWNLLLHMPCQSRFVAFLIVPLQLAREHDSILIDVLALHCMQKEHLICFYKNPPVSGFHPTAHFPLTECFEFLLWCPILEYLLPCLVMYEVISNIFRCSRCSEETD